VNLPHFVVIFTTPEFALDPAGKERQLFQLLIIEEVVDRPSAPPLPSDASAHTPDHATTKLGTLHSLRHTTILSRLWHLAYSWL